MGSGKREFPHRHQLKCHVIICSVILKIINFFLSLQFAQIDLCDYITFKPISTDRHGLLAPEFPHVSEWPPPSGPNSCSLFLCESSSPCFGDCSVHCVFSPQGQPRSRSVAVLTVATLRKAFFSTPGCLVWAASPSSEDAGYPWSWKTVPL